MQQLINYPKLGFTAVLASGLSATIIGLATSTAFAQQVTTSPLTVQSTGTISGTLELPFFNPNYNRVLTIVDTDENGIYYRNVGTNNNPEWVQVYQSDQVIQVRKDGSMRPFVRFKGIPVTSFDAVIDSPVLSDGEMTTFKYDGRDDMEGAVIKAVVQDEFGVKKSYYTGTLTDPETGTQYRGTFKITGQGPRYSDRNGGDSPNVFDYKSDQPGKPRAEPYKIKDNSPLVKLYITVPEGTPIVTPTTGGDNPPTTGGSTPPTTGGSTPPTTGGSTPPTTGGTTPPTTGGSTPPTTGGSTPPTTGGSTPPTTGGSTPPTTGGSTLPTTGSSTPPTTGGSTPPSTPSTNLAPPSYPITSSPSNPSTNLAPTSSPITSSPSTPSTSSTPSPDLSGIEFSSGNSFVSNSVVKNPSNFNKAACFQDSVCNPTLPQPKQRGPRSRVMIR